MPSLRSPLHGSSYSQQHIWHVQARPIHTAQPARSPRRSRRGGSGGGGGAPGPEGAYGLPGGGPYSSAPWCEQEEVPKARSTELRSSWASSTCASFASVNSASRSASRIPCSASSASRRASVQGRAGGGQRIPGARRGVSFPVLHGVQEMREPSEEPPGLGERLRVAGPPGQDRGVREGGGGRGLGRFGDGQQRGARARRAPRCPPAGPRRRPARRCRSRRRNRYGHPPGPSSRRPGGPRAPPAGGPTARPRRPCDRAPSPRRAPARRRPRAGLPHPGRPRRSAFRAMDRAPPCAAILWRARPEPPSEPISASRRSS